MAEPRTDIFQFQAQLGERLAQWSRLSIASGLILTLLGNRTWRGVGTQFAGWGLIDLIIAWIGLRSARNKAATPANHAPEAQARERANLKRVLWINAGLDIGYVTGGALLTKHKGRADPFWRGAGWGIIIQGAFLLVFDLVHALQAGAPMLEATSQQGRRTDAEASHA